MITFDKEYYINIDGDYTKKQPVGYCFCELHRGYLTTNELKTHKCISKECPHLFKNTNHQYWAEQENLLLKKRYYRMINKNHKHGLINQRDYLALRRVSDIDRIKKYIGSYNNINLDNNEVFQTKSNYISKEIIIPKKPSLYARIKNTIRIKYRKAIKRLNKIFN